MRAAERENINRPNHGKAETGVREDRRIVYFDLEVSERRKEAVDYAAVLENDECVHTGSVSEFLRFVNRSQYICGHNIIAHDMKYIKGYFDIAHYDLTPIDTLLLSPLLNPEWEAHSLEKAEKAVPGEWNNPLNDAVKARTLLHSQIDRFKALPEARQRAYSALLGGRPGFQGFFEYLNCGAPAAAAELIEAAFRGRICSHADLQGWIAAQPVALAYVLAACANGEAGLPLSAWVRENYPAAYNIYNALRGRGCAQGCAYCSRAFDLNKRLREIFGFERFRAFDGVPLQQSAVEAAVEGKSLLAVFPTGGGKSMTFQLPAIIAGGVVDGLTVVISPLLSLMKDQVDNLEGKGMIEAVAINSLLSPVERAEALERVREGRVSILYIAPEALRSKTIESILLERNVVRFVVDEAHCFSAWGQDFRVDYLFIAPFIKQLQDKMKDPRPIAVSCFTATAKLRVIADICDYFRRGLGLELEVFAAESARKNLNYRFLPAENDQKKYQTLRELVEARDCPTIVYVSRTKEAESIAERLAQDGYSARPFHGRMERGAKIENQNAFINDEVRIIVATSAFGMGVDKRDVQLVVHYDISGSLEDYFQESGRAGRDERLTADCYVLYNDDDLNKHFQNLTRSKLNAGEINQIWRAIKQLPSHGSTVTRSALEIARKAGWNEESQDSETRVKTAINALENAGYIQRGMNSPVVYATSIQVKNMEEAQARLQRAELSEPQLLAATRVAKTLITERSIAGGQGEKPETRVDYIADTLGMPREDAMRAIELLKSCGILADSKDMTVFLQRGEKGIKSNLNLRLYAKLEEFMLRELMGGEEALPPFTYIELNTRAGRAGVEKPTVSRIKDIIYFWTIRKYIEKTTSVAEAAVCRKRLMPREAVWADFERRIALCNAIIRYLQDKALQKPVGAGDTLPVTFSLAELTERCGSLLGRPSNEDVEYALLYLSKIRALELDGGFLVLYNALRIRKLVPNRVQYKKDDYKQLDVYYNQRKIQIHAVGDFARRMIDSAADALAFSRDYFQMESEKFLRKYYPGERREEIKRSITPQKYQALFGDLSLEQKAIIDDGESQYIVVAAGPGSGKTRVLVHKLAALLHLEDVKHEQLLMLTFSRAAATEFKDRLRQLYGGDLPFVEIRTFHSYCYKLLGKYGSGDENETVVRQAIDMIRSGEADDSRIAKSVLVIDEAQDMDEDEFTLIEALINKNENMRVVAVGDDDQNIFSFRGADAKYMERLISQYGARRYDLLDNFRSGGVIVAFANSLAATLSHRIKASMVRPLAEAADSGRVVLTRHVSRNLEIPVAESLAANRGEGRACVLTRTNEEALNVLSLLQKKGIPARLIQSNDGFNLLNLAEIRYFIKALDGLTPEGTFSITNKIWGQALDKLRRAYGGSTCLDACMALLKRFWETEYEKRRSDLIEFIQESRLEDFQATEDESDAVVVSTMHKAKGREFDQVFILLDRYKLRTDDEKRLLYVAVTRAKKELYIHYNGDTLDFINGGRVERRYDRAQYEKPGELILSLTHEDVYLDSFEGKKGRILRKRGGDPLEVRRDGLYFTDAVGPCQAVAFSRGMRAKLAGLSAKGYELSRAEIQFIVAWRAKDKPDGEELAIILPLVYLTRRQSSD